MLIMRLLVLIILNLSNHSSLTMTRMLSGPLVYESSPYSCYVSLCVLQACVWASPPTCAGICLTSSLEAHVRLRSAFRYLVLYFYCVLVSVVISVVTAPTNLHNGSMMGPALDLRELAFRGSTAIQITGPQRGLRHVLTY